MTSQEVHSDVKQIYFPKKEKKISLIFGWKIYVMVEQRILYSYGKLYIWTSELN